MDQMKSKMAAVKQHSFWGMCVGILLVTLGSWWHSTGVLKKQQEEQLSKIETATTSLQGIRSGNQDHPNKETSDAMDLLTSRVGAAVAEGWQLQYDKQADVLVWPESFSPGFREAVDKLRPIEIIPPPPTTFADELPEPLLIEYRNYIDTVLPSLAEKIGAIWTAKVATSSNAMGGMGGGYDPTGGMPGAYGSSPSGSYGGYDPTGGGYSPSGYGPGVRPKPEEQPIVIWDPNNQQQLLQMHFGFTSRVSAPSTLEVLYAQEDFWVLDNIMDIVRRTNDPAGEGLSGPHQATIKRIYFVRIGRSARGMSGRISSGGGASAPGGYSMSGTPGMSMDATTPSASMPGPSMSTSTPGASSTAGTTSYMDPAEGRYVDPQYQPLPAARLRSALESDSADDALLAVAKRMPVRMRFRIDQRRLNRLLAECGNAKLPVEVRQVRINRPEGAGGGMGMGMPGMDGGYDPGGMGGGYDPTAGGGYDPTAGSGYDPTAGGGMPGYDPYDSGAESGYSSFGGMPGSGLPGSGPPTKRAAKAGSWTEDATVNLHEIDVELYGIVYIYNPVNKKQLGIETETTTVASDGTQPAEPSAETPPAAETTQPLQTTPTSTGPSTPVASGPVPPAVIAP